MVFLIPVTWYLILQLFGDNKFSLSLQYKIDDECGMFSDIAVVTVQDSLTMTETNYMNRVVYAAKKRRVSLISKDASFFSCIDQSEADLILISEEGLWGAYELTRKGVDQLLTELDILKLQKSYGQGTRR